MFYRQLGTKVVSEKYSIQTMEQKLVQHRGTKVVADACNASHQLEFRPYKCQNFYTTMISGEKEFRPKNAFFLLN